MRQQPFSCQPTKKCEDVKSHKCDYENLNLIKISPLFLSQKIKFQSNSFACMMLKFFSVEEIFLIIFRF